MKILDRYILTTYLKTFISVFLILVLIFILQTIWLYIKELAGKDLDIDVIIKFIFYFLPKLMPLVIPLTILLSSIMVFGSFAENYEFAAMKSTGISLQRAMSGLSVFVIILGFTTFVFSNNVIPWAEFNSYNLRKNIAKLKPAMLLAEGQFNPVSNYNIKFEKKSGERDQFLEDVVIHIKGSNGRNTTSIIARNGELVGKETSNVLKLILKDGNYYSDIESSNARDRRKNPFAKSTFDVYTINIDLTQLNDVDIDDKSLSDRYNMLNLSGLDKAMDSLAKKQLEEHETFATNLYQRTNIENLKITFNRQFNTNIEGNNKINDSIYDKPLIDFFDTEGKLQVLNSSLNTINSTKHIIASREPLIKFARTDYKKHVVSYHEKLALGFACVILFFVGAPLGALIRKGGIGLPLVVAILLFLTYHFIGIFATNSAKNGNFNPILASWFSTLVMLPLSVYLTKRATADRGLFEFGSILQPIRKIFRLREKNAIDYSFLKSYKTDELIDVINNYEALGHDETTRYKAFRVLNYRGITIEDVREKGVSIKPRYDEAIEIAKDYKEHSKFAIILYTTGASLLILHFVFANNKMPSLSSASIQLSLVSFALYIVYYVKSMINLFAFTKHVKRKKPNIILIILGLPLYFITYPFARVKVKEYLKLNFLNSLK